MTLSLFQVKRGLLIYNGRVARWTSTDVSQEHVATVMRVED
jgi:hypothetical protein